MKRVTFEGDQYQANGLPNGHSTVSVLLKDSSENALIATGTTVPSTLAGYAKSCLFIKTDAAGGTKGLYENTGTTTSCSFDLIGSISSAEIAANAITPIKMGTRTLVALADSAATPTISQLMTSSIFTMTPGAARNFTTPTAAAIVAGVTGATNGSWFDFTIVNLADFPITVVAGDGDVTLSGQVIVNKGSATFRAVLTDVSASEAVSIYRMDGLVTTSTAAELNILDGCTASYAELNYNDITTLGTGAASKSVVLDAGEDYTWPATGILTYGVLKDPAGTALTATTAEINARCAVASIGQTITDAGAQAVTAGKQSVLLNNAAATIAATIADATQHFGYFVVKAGLEPAEANDHTCTITTGTWDGVNKVATFADINDALVVFFDHAGNGTIISNTGAVGLS